MIIIKQNNITIPRGISPSFVTTDHDISLQKKTVTITKNGVSTITPDSGYDALSSVRVTTDIHPTPKLQNIVKTYVENGNFHLTPGDTYDGIGNVSITIDVPEKVFKTQDKNISITENGDYNVAKDSSVDGMNNVSISVNVPEKVFKTQDKNENIVSNGDYRYTADESFDGLKSVNVHVEVPEKKIILQNKDITENGSVTYDDGYDGLGTVNVNVPIPEYKSQTKDVSYVNNGSFTLKPDIDFDGISQANITVNVPEKEINLQDKNIAISENGDYNVSKDSSFDGMNNVSISVNVPEKVYKTQEKTAVPTTSEQRIIPDSSFDALSAVNISAVDSTIDSNIIPENIKKGISILGVEGTNEPHVFPMGTVLAQDILSDEPAPQNLVYNAAERDIDGYSNVEIERIAQERITKTITANGTITIKPSTDYDVIKDANITVNVPSKDPNLQEKTIDASSLYNETKDVITETITPDNDFDGLSKVTYTRLNLAKNRTTAVGVLPDKSGSYVFFKPENGFDGFLNFGFRINYQEPTVDPSTSQQLIEPSTGYACFKNVTVNPVTSAIDSNIIPANIKKGVSILGVEGSYDKSIRLQQFISTNDTQFWNVLKEQGSVKITPDSGYDGLSEAVIKNDYKLFHLNVTPSIEDQSFSIRDLPPSYFAYGSITASPVTSSIDANIKPANIKKGVSILGVEGSLETTKTQEKTLAKSDLINNTNESVTVELVPDSSFTGMSKISYPKINLNNNFTVEFRVPSDDKFSGLNLNVPVAGFDGVSKVSYKTRRQDKTVTPSTTKQTVNCDSGYVGIRSVTVNPVDKIPLRYIECDGNTVFKLISTNDTLNLLNSYTCDIQCSFTQAVSITSESTLLNFLNITGSSHKSEVIVRFGRHSSGSNMLQTHVHGEDKNILINNNYSQYTLGDETCIDVQIHNSVDSSTASNKVIISDISGASGSNINTTLPNELIAFGGYTSSGKLVCTSSSGYRIHRIILHRDQVASWPDKTRTYYEFIPVLHDGKPCFFETSTKTYRYNLGTGTPKYEIL